jgi:hypothetical protein
MGDKEEIGFDVKKIKRATHDALLMISPRIRVRIAETANLLDFPAIHNIKTGWMIDVISTKRQPSGNGGLKPENIAAIVDVSGILIVLEPTFVHIQKERLFLGQDFLPSVGLLQLSRRQEFPREEPDFPIDVPVFILFEFGKIKNGISESQEFFIAESKIADFIKPRG